MPPHIMRLKLCLPRRDRPERVRERETHQTLRRCRGTAGAQAGRAEECDADGLVPGRLGEVAQGELQAREVDVLRGVGLEVEESAVEGGAGGGAAVGWG